MIDSKLIELYQKLDKSDLRQFKKWVHSPIHNDHKDVKQLFAFIYSRNALSAVTLQKKRAWSYIYPKQDYDDARLRYLMALALRLLTDFVGYKTAVNDNYTTHIMRSKYFLEQEMPKPSQQQLDLAQQSIASETHNAQYHYQQYYIETLKFELEGNKNWGRTTNISTITQHARSFFMITTLRHACIALSHQNVRKENYSIPMLEAILQEVKAGDYEQEAVLMIYYHGYLAFTNLEDTTNFLALKAYLLDQSQKLNTSTQREVLVMAINYCVKLLNSDQLNYIREAFELYRYGLKHNCLMINHKMTIFAYANIVALGLNLKEFDWIETFIPQYSKFLDVPNPQNYEHHNTARLAFARGDFDKTMSLLTQVEYDDLFLNMTAKIILLKIYYQENYFDALEALLESFRVFLNRKKILSYHKTNLMNLIKLTRKLLYLAPGEQHIKKLREQIKTTNPLAERKWLLEQLDKVK